MILKTPPESLVEFMRRGPYVGYCYSYPHKTAYRPFPSERSLDSVWGKETQDALFLYVHIPFCEFRCGFCNLFTYSQPNGNLVDEYLAAVRRHAKVIHDQLPIAVFRRAAIGGGTPSYLSVAQLHNLFDTIRQFGVDGRQVPYSFEISPSTIDAEKLALLDEFGVERISLGVQSLDARDVNSMGRPQDRNDVFRAVDLIRGTSISKFNLDLIYGAEHQTLESWRNTLEQVIEMQPDEVYAYPLYVRPLTGLAKIGRDSTDFRLDLYRAARECFLTHGYEQRSMRMFERAKSKQDSLPDYQCQRDGMVGIGCGARSYTKTCHYGSIYAVRQQSILQRIQDYVSLNDQQIGQPVHGIDLDQDEQRRRYLILSLLLVDGLKCQEYATAFGASPFEHFPELEQLIDEELCVLETTTPGLSTLKLSIRGLEWSDNIGPWLYSPSIRDRMAEYAWSD